MLAELVCSCRRFLGLSVMGYRRNKAQRTCQPGLRVGLLLVPAVFQYSKAWGLFIVLVPEEQIGAILSIAA